MEPVPLTVMHRYPHGESVYDAIWLTSGTLQAIAVIPAKRIADRFLTSSRDHPIQLFDLSLPTCVSTFCSSTPYDDIAAPLCLSMAPGGRDLYCGHENLVRVFDVTRPGRDFLSMPTTPSRGSRDGLKGIISAIAFSPSGAIFAAGSFSKCIGIYASEHDEVSQPLAIFGAHVGGVTHLAFLDEHTLISGGRRDNHLCLWDIRDTQAPIAFLPRACANNQRLLFDIATNMIASVRSTVQTGGQFAEGQSETNTQAESAANTQTQAATSQGDLAAHGEVATQTQDQFAHTMQAGIVFAGDHDGVLRAYGGRDGSPLAAFKAHGDPVTAASAHPTLPLLATCSGTRRVGSVGYDSDSEEEEEKVVGDSSVRVWRWAGQWRYS
mgnify:CR=1 FL=1